MKNINKSTLKIKDNYKKGVCLKCKKEIDINIPTIVSGRLMYSSIDHGCGKEYVQWVFTMEDTEI